MKKIMMFGIVVVTSMGMWACGSSEPEGPTAEEVAAAQVQADAEACEESLSDLLPILEKLDSGLDIGYTEAEYSALVIKAKYAYDSLDLDELSDTCVTDVAIYAETAMRLYYRVSLIWQECPACISQFEPAFSKAWFRAEDNIERAEEGLDNYSETTEIPAPPVDGSAS